MRFGDGADIPGVHHPTPRRAAALLAAASLTSVAAAPASAQLGLPLPNLGTVVQDLGKTIDSIVPTGGLVTTVTGTVGGVVTGVQDTVTGTVDSVLGGVLEDGSKGVLPTTTLDSLLGTLGLSNAGGGGSGGSGGGGSTGGIVTPGGVSNGNVLDAAAPEPAFKILSTLRQVHRTGSLRIQVTTNEPGIVAVGGAIRPGFAVKKKAAKKKARTSAARHDRRLIKFPAAVLAYRKAGTLTMTVKLGKAARRTLGKSRDARVSFAVIAADVVRNQASSYEKVRVKR